MRQKMLLVAAAFFGALAFILMYQQIKREKEKALRGSVVVSLPVAMASADPTTLGVRIQSVCRGFPEQGVAFAKAYLALPAIPSVVVESGLKDKDVVLRKIATDNGTYFAVINRGFALAGKDLALGCFPRDGKMVDLVSGEELDNVSGSVRIKLEPMSLRAFLIK